MFRSALVIRGSKESPNRGPADSNLLRKLPLGQKSSGQRDDRIILGIVYYRWIAAPAQANLPTAVNSIGAASVSVPACPKEACAGGCGKPGEVNRKFMQREGQAVISVISGVLGWTLGLAIAGAVSIVITPGTILSFLRGRRYIWWEYARWALTGVLLGMFVYELRNLGFHWQELYFLPVLGAVNLMGRGLKQVPSTSPWRWGVDTETHATKFPGGCSLSAGHEAGARLAAVST